MTIHNRQSKPLLCSRRDLIRLGWVGSCYPLNMMYPIEAEYRPVTRDMASWVVVPGTSPRAQCIRCYSQCA